MITIYPIDTPEGRKQRPLATGVLDYFPDALLEVALCSLVGNEQHNPGQPLHWDRSKSTGEADACVRHLSQRGTVDSDGVRHSAKAAWRALANLQKEIEAGRTVPSERVCVAKDEDDEDYARIGNRCEKQSKWSCTRTKGHSGPHIARFSGYDDNEAKVCDDKAIFDNAGVPLPGLYCDNGYWYSDPTRQSVS